MVVLSRPRSAHKAGPKLSVPPPLNLPSLRKEHERFDSAGSGGGPAGGGVPGSGPRPNSAGMGWTKPTAVALQEKEGLGDHGADGIEQSNLHGNDGTGRGNSVYMPPSARPGSVGPIATASAPAYHSVEKAVLLRGEDFPSLQAATLPSASGPSQKQKDGLNQKQRQVRDELLNEQRGSTHSSTIVDMRPQLQTSGHGTSNVLNENGGESRGFGGNRASEQAQKQDDYFPGPLPLVRLNPRSDWADDERDTGHGFTDRSRDHGFSHTESYWDRDFDMPRISVLPHKPVHNLSERQGLHDNETGKVSSSEVPKVDQYGRDVRTPSREEREGSSWRTGTLSRDGITDQVDRNGFGARPSSLNRETAKENKHNLMPFQEDARDNFGRNNAGYNHGGRQPWNNAMDSHASRGTEWNRRDRYGSEQQNRYRGDKRPFSKSEKPYVEDFGSTDFDTRDPFSGGLLGVVKKKKDVTRQTDFHDPVRESFEAELERVQKMQEQERQRILDEQEKALELARREEEERARLAKEHIERQRRLEEEAREAAWRAEQEQLEAMRRAEEQRVAREEEKRRLFMEEERRKHAAKQKLIELEERIAKRKAETAKAGGNSLAVADENMSRMVKDNDVSRDVGEWEDGERMVERITASGSSDSSLNRSFEMGSRPHLPRDSSAFVDGGKPVNSWRRDVYENGNNSTLLLQDQVTGHHSPRRDRDLPVGGRTQSRKEHYGGGGLMPSRTYHKGGVAESHIDDIPNLRGQRWNLSGNVDHYSRNTEIESDFHDNFAEKFSDVGWGQGRVHDNPYSPYPEPLYPNSDADGPYSFGRSRYSVRQPRVLPPPSLASIHRPSYRGEPDCPGPSAFTENEMQYNHAARSESTVQTGYDGSRPENLGQPEILEVKQENAGNMEQKLDSTRRCDSQSSLSVSSPPSSPTPLSHDDLDESRDSSVLSAPGDSKNVSLPGQENEPLVLPTDPGKDSSSVSVGDDEEWAVENHEQHQEQEEYDEDEDGYEEEDEVHEDMHLEGKESPDMDNFVLYLNEGVEVGMPNDEYDRTSRNEESTFVVPQVSSGTVEEHGSSDGIHTGEKTLQHMDDSSQLGVGSSSRVFLETEKAMQNLIIQPNNVPHKTAGPERVDFVDASSSGSSSQHHVASSISLTPQPLSSQTVMSTVSAIQNQTEGPFKLQFGLFSGPSLIPSPVPAIQIGSIQMPLPLHPQVGPSLAHMHLSQPPLFQFGQLRYTSPISQGVLPLAPQSMSFIQPNIPSGFSVNQNPGGHQPIHSGQGNTQTRKNDVISLPTDNRQGLASRHLDPSQGNVSEGVNHKAADKNAETSVMGQQGAAKSYIGDSSSRSGSLFQGEDQGHGNLVGKNFSPFSGNRESENHSQIGASSAQSIVRGRDISGPKALDLRTEFRVRASADKRQSTGSVSSNHVGHEVKYAPVRGLGPSVRSGPRKVVMSNKHSRQISVSEGIIPGSSSSQEIEYGSRTEKGVAKDALAKSHNFPQSGEGNLKRHIHSEEDVYAPLQSGVVRVFEQPGIEAPSDEDDFIEVRSKRQMLNDRREQREKEIKAKSWATKVVVPRKPRSTLKGTTIAANLGKNSTVANGEAGNSIRSDFVATEGHGLANTEVSAGFNTTGTQPLAPIGTPAVKSDGQADIRSQTMRSLHASSLPVVSGGAKNLGRGMILDNKNKVPDNVRSPLGSWGNSQSNQQVMSLTQTQLDDAMKPGHFDSRAAVESLTTSVSSMSSSSILAKDKLFSSAANPINSLLAGEKIQFGAVTSPTILPSTTENDCNLLFEKEKHPTESSGQLEDSEAEAEAAASAVAVAAISSDEIVGNLGSCSVSGADTKSFVGAGIDGITGGGSGDQQLASQSRAEESLSVSLPADLSVETPPISLWPPVPSPQNPSAQMLPHFPGGPPSHFPFYEMNPLMGAPVFAYGPPDESASANQSQSQKNNASPSAPLGTWQQCHSGVDSFYGPPAGFTGPFISPAGGIPGVQGPPHMVVYNHFAPVGQFGQVGLSFMGTTYIPSGKQPDWKHNPVSSAMGVSEVEMNNMNMVSTQRNPTNMSAPVQHLAPGSPLLPMPSPMALFDVSPFQSSADMSVQARWPHVPAAPPQSVPLSMPLQQQGDGMHPSKFSQGHGPVDQSLTGNRFPESRASATLDNSRNFPVATDATVARFPDELGLVGPSSSGSTGASTQSVGTKSSAISTSGDGNKTQVDPNLSSSSVSGHNNASSNVKSQPSQHKNQQYGHSSYYQRGGSQKNSSGGEWSHRRMGFHGRNQSMGAEKSFPSKMKQVYVAKQTPSGN
ncbi:PREDICTED: uncharacterized protein LOC101306533 [Fragaria vesca subsp. vesca]